MPDDLLSGDYSSLVGIVIAGFLVLVVLGVLLAVRSGRRRSDEVEVRLVGRAQDDTAMQTHLRAASQAHHDAQAAHQEAMRVAQAASAPPAPSPPTV